MKEAAQQLLERVEELASTITDEDQTYLLEVFIQMLCSDEFLEEEGYFREHGEPKPREGFDLAELLNFPDLDPELLYAPEVPMEAAVDPVVDAAG